MYTITLFIGDGYWQTQHDDPEVMELFGTDVIPTPFSSSIPKEKVLADLIKLNPDRIVK